MKAIFYKEWLKIRWAYLVMSVLTLLVLVYIMLSISKQIEFNKAVSIWGVIIFKKYKFFSDIEFIPLLIGAVIGITQYAPEANQSRLKLTLHLPVKENLILSKMLLSGFAATAFLYFIIAGGLTLITSSYFPAEIVIDMLNTITPWLLAGTAAYFASAAIFIEPAWPRRIILILITTAFLSLLYNMGDHSVAVLLLFAFITFLIPFWTFLTGYNFKRGII